MRKDGERHQGRTDVRRAERPDPIRVARRGKVACQIVRRNRLWIGVGDKDNSEKKKAKTDYAPQSRERGNSRLHKLLLLNPCCGWL